jgi:hypothetical protein
MLRIVEQNGAIIVKNRACLIERDPMLPLIDSIFVFIPFKN